MSMRMANAEFYIVQLCESLSDTTCPVTVLMMRKTEFQMELKEELWSKCDQWICLLFLAFSYSLSFKFTCPISALLVFISVWNGLRS